MRPTAWMLSLGLLLAACASPPAPPSPTAAPTPSGPTLYALPTAAWLVLGPNQSPMACAGVGLDAIARGSVGDPRHVWLANQMAGGSRIDLVWPRGYAARFTPDLEVIDAQGRVVLREGQHVDGGCVTGQDRVLWLPNW